MVPSCQKISNHFNLMSNIEDVLSTIPRFIFYLNHHYIHLRHHPFCHRSILSVKIRVVAFLRSGGLRADGSTDRRAIKEPQLTLQYNAKPYDLFFTKNQRTNPTMRYTIQWYSCSKLSLKYTTPPALQKPLHKVYRLFLTELSALQ